MPKQRPKQKKIAKQAKPGKKRTTKALKPSKLKKQTKASKPAKAKAVSKSSKPPKSAKAARTSKPAKASKPIKPAKQAKKAERKAKRAAKKQKRSPTKKAPREQIEVRPSKSLTAEEKATRLPLASPRMRIGLLGGSFNPAHAAHVEISLTALKRLGLDQVWWVVTPGNPLKHPVRLPSLSERVTAARKLASHPRIAVTGFPGDKGSAYTVDLLTALKRRYAEVSFVWLMGADNLAGFHRWRSWQKIFEIMPIAVLDRPGFRLKARASQAATRFQSSHVDESDALGLPRMMPPAWTIISHRLSPLSSTALRAEAKGKKAGDKKRKKRR